MGAAEDSNVDPGMSQRREVERRSARGLDRIDRSALNERDKLRTRRLGDDDAWIKRLKGSRIGGALHRADRRKNAYTTAPTLFERGLRPRSDDAKNRHVGIAALNR